MSTPENGQVLFQQNGNIGEIILDRPSKHNALTPTMYDQINEVCQQANNTDSVHVVIIHGAGERAFCAGSDIKALEGYEDFWAWRNRNDYIPPILNIKKPTIAAVKGWALGGGLEIALACDLRVVANSSMFAAPEVQLGWNGAGGAAQHLTRMCGYGQAMKWLLTGDRFNAEQANAMGMVEWLVEPGEELTTAREIAAKIAAYSSVATQSVKASVRNAMELGLSQGLKNENDLMSLCFAKMEAAKLRE